MTRLHKVAEPSQPVFLTRDTLLARYAEIPADLRHGLPVQQTGNKAQAFFHNRTRFPRHPHLPQNKSGKCNPCVRYEMSPMSQAAQPVGAPRLARATRMASGSDASLVLPRNQPQVVGTKAS
jgi:hypothetical protein